MSTNDATAPAGEGPKNEFKAPASQDELDRIIQKRLDREREKYVDYDELKNTVAEQTERVSELESMNTTLSEQVAGFEQEKELSQLIKDVANTKGVPAEALKGTTEEELNAHADILKSIIHPSAPVIEGQAKTPGETPRDPGRETVKQLFGNT